MVGLFFFLHIRKLRTVQQTVCYHKLEMDKTWIVSQLSSNSVTQIKYFVDLKATAEREKTNKKIYQTTERY